MASVITLKGIDQGIYNLDYRNKNALKYRLVNIIRQFYENESSVESIQGIDSDELVKVLWNTGDDPATIKKKRKNLSSIKSSVNANFKKLYKEGKNPDGIIIGPANIFVMSDEAKDKVLKSFKNRITDEGTATLGQIADILNIVNEILSKPEAIANAESAKGLRKYDQLKNLIQGLSEKVGLGGSEPADSASKASIAIPGEKETTGGPDVAEVTENHEDIEEVEVDDAIEEELEELESDDELEEVEIVVEPEKVERATYEVKAEVSLEQAKAAKGLKEDNMGKGAEGAGLYKEDGERVDKAKILEEVAPGEGRRFDETQEPLLEEALREVGVTYDLEKTEAITALGNKEKTGGPYRAEAKEMGEGLKEILGDDTPTVEKSELIEGVRPEEGVVSEETQGLKVQGKSIAEEEVIENLEDVEVDDTIEEAEPEEDLEQVAIDDDLEDLKVDDISEEAEEDLEEVEVIDSLEEEEEDLEEVEVDEDLEEVDEVEEAEESDLLAGNLGEEYSDGGYGEDDEIEKARVLAEGFNSSLADMDKFYNQYIIIQEGEFIVGSKLPKKDEKPEQVVHLSHFYIGKFPITNALFEIFVEKTGYKTTAEKIGYSTVYYGRSQKIIDIKTGLKRLIWNSALINKTVKGACWYQPLGPGSTLYNKKNHPVVHVSLEDAIAFAAWSGKRLPTEDEWEAASRTANGYVFPWGNDWKKDSCNIEESSIGDTAPVDKYIELANDFGIVDTIGNVLEWTSDTSESPSYVKNRSKFYIIKGGSWISGNDIRLFSRFKLEPESHSNILGFRCVAY